MLALPVRRSKNASWSYLTQVRRLSVRQGPPRGITERESRHPRPTKAARKVRRDGKDGTSTAAAMPPLNRVSTERTPSLVEQLFPEEEAKRRQTTTSDQHGDLPRVPLDRPARSAVTTRSNEHHTEDKVRRSQTSIRMEEEMRSQGTVTSVLVLRNASKNLTEEDFRRLVPQGQHMEGWKLEQGDILKIVPGRSFATLAFAGCYYLLFSSALSAFTYQGHVTRLSQIVASQTPRSFNSPIPPAPGSIIHGVDAFAAMQSYALSSPTQQLSLNQLAPPLNSVMQAIVDSRGYPWLADRPDKMPHEARLTLEGPQLSALAIRHAIIRSAQARKLSWTCDEEPAPIVTKWDSTAASTHPALLSAAREFRDRANRTSGVHNEQDAEWFAQISATQVDETEYDLSSTDQKQEAKRRAMPPVFIVGFRKRKALESFVQHWHRRPIEDEHNSGKVSPDREPPPIANVEVLW